jgi:hypothetical protein
MMLASGSPLRLGVDGAGLFVSARTPLNQRKALLAVRFSAPRLATLNMARDSIKPDSVGVINTLGKL